MPQAVRKHTANQSSQIIVSVEFTELQQPMRKGLSALVFLP
jgi:hypothetical protein